MKSYTDLNQSRKLAEILPLESADMCFNTRNNMPPLMTPYSRFNEFYDMEPTPAFLIPCWSLAALLGVIPDISLNAFKDGFWNAMVQHNGKMIYGDKDNPIDACYEMILKLHEQKLL